MLKELIKRNGQIEARDDRKLNGWGEWASNHLGERIDWSTAALAAVGKMPERASTRELMVALIDELLTINSYPSHLMAGRLYANVIRKDLFGTATPPTVFAVQSKLIATGMMADMGYSLAEYAQIESFIDHEQDYFCPEYSLRWITEKYAIRNYITGEVFETPQFVYMRMAMELARSGDEAGKIQRVQRFYNVLSNKKLSAPTPNYLYLGTKHRGFASCCIYTAGDTVESLAIGNHIAFMMTANSAGLGSFINTRTVGDPIDGGRVKHGGKYRYLKCTATDTIANKQAARSGAGTTSIMCFDPEVIDVLQYRNPMMPEDKQNRDLHYSLLYNRFFARKVASNEDIFTFTQYSAPDLFEAFFLGQPDLFAKLYAKYEADATFVKQYVSARKIVKFMFAEAFNTGTSYNANIDEIAIHTPFKIEPGHVIHCANLCVAPETEILTDAGYVEIKSKAGEFVNVWNGQEWSEVQVVKTGEDQKLVTVVLDNGLDLDCTLYHKWYIVDDYGQPAREVRTHELKPGDKLIKFDFPVVEGLAEDHMAYQHGFYCGDGCDTPQGQRVYLYGSKMALQSRFPQITKWIVQKNLNRAYGHMPAMNEKYWVPNAQFTKQTRLEWLAGYLDADGTVCRNGDNESIQVKSTNFEFIKKVQLMLSTLGVSSKVKQVEVQRTVLMPANNGTEEKKEYVANPAWRLTINSIETQKLLELGLKTSRLEIEVRRPQRSAAQFVKVVGVSDFGRTDDTYCFTEPKRHMGVFNGILTGQCQEICEIQSPYFDMRDLYSAEDHGRGEIAMCNLAAIPVDNIENDAEYEEVCYLALKMIDHTILNGDYPFPHLAFTAKQRMNAGVGMMGVATHMARKGLRWDTPEGKAEIHAVSERHMYFLIKASLKIAKERGNAPWIHKTKWPEGWLPIDTYNKNVDKIGNFKYQYDWEALRSEIIEQGGIAHSVLNAGMPGESSSKALGSTNAFYPVRSRTLSKTDGSGIVLRWAAKDEDLLGDAYQSAYDISTKDLIDNYAIMQKFADHSLSCDYYKRFTDADMQVTDDEIFETFLYQTSRGPKNRYYTNNLRPKKNKNIEDMMDAVAGDQSHTNAPVIAVSPDAVVHPYEHTAVLDVGMLSSLTGVPAMSAMTEAAAMTESENDNKCEGFCSL